jgi:hypothetical protein
MHEMYGTTHTELKSRHLGAHSNTRRAGQLSRKSRNHRLLIIEPDHEDAIEATFFFVATQHLCSTRASIYRKTK